MKHPQQKRTDGFALLIFLIVLMGIAGLALTGFSQNALKSVEKSRFEHNKRVLLEAKQALLMYAYNYPVIVAGRGPGRLPCPDTDNNGRAEAGSPCLFNNEVVGRLPWDNPDLKFYDAKDASGERLWYAVSETFDYGAGTTINSDSLGTISIFDQAGNLLYDGAANGVAAVIIAPGSAINNQDRSITNGDDPSGIVPDTDPGIVNPANYLDSLNAFDNSAFINTGNADADGFRLGPVIDQSIEVINDQIIIITADEVIAMAEKATLQAYREEIDDYRTNIAEDRYPWLDAYTTTDLDEYDADVNTRIGRVPSIFSEYFEDNDTVSRGMVSDIRLVNISYTPSAPVPLNISIPATDVQFDGAGNLSANFGLNSYYYWDETVGPDGWEICPFVTGTVNDCNQSAPGVFVLDPFVDPNTVPIRVIRIKNNDFPGTITFNFGYGGGATGPAYNPPTTTNNAEVSFQFPFANIATPEIFEFEYDSNYLLAYTPAADDEFWESTETMQFHINYYPTLPEWIVDNDWHNTVQMAYSAAYEPGSVLLNCTTGTDCLTVDNQGGVPDDIIALLALASAHGIEPDNGVAGFQDDLAEIFEGENNNINDTFDTRPPIFGSDDVVLILDEL